MAFYEQRVGLCLEFSMTSFRSRAACSQDSGCGVGLRSAEATVHRVVTPEEEQLDLEADGDNYTGSLSASDPESGGVVNPGSSAAGKWDDGRAAALSPLHATFSSHFSPLHLNVSDWMRPSLSPPPPSCPHRATALSHPLPGTPPPSILLRPWQKPILPSPSLRPFPYPPYTPTSPGAQTTERKREKKKDLHLAVTEIED
ncbi:unnamed protein product [Pleuronectes platessa]|uniref:Uncharacterized protein n=1 Tax=Pleuronectes platessa TaxID=8262 RepID=A0A9N7VRI3_PLEPL|nr:unnamed protein product [Pleuronectes platessa]